MEPLAVEPRSFAGCPVGELRPIDLEGKTVKEALQAVLGGVHQTHACLEQHIFEQRKRDLEADEKRQRIAEDLLLAKGVALDTRSEVRDLALAFGVRKPDPGEEKPKTRSVATWGAKEAGAAIAAATVALPVSVAGAVALWGFLHALWPGVVPPAPSVKG